MTSAVTAPPTVGRAGTTTIPDRRGAALRLALRLYLGELGRNKPLSGAALILPAVGNIGVTYVPPLLVGQLVGRLAAGEPATSGLLAPYVFGFLAAMLAGEALWRVGIHCLNRTEATSIARLHVSGMDALLAKDAAFFHENFAGSLTKRVLSFA